VETVLQRVVDVAKVWGRERYRMKQDKPRLRPLVISFLDEDGKVLYSWKIDKDGEGEQTLAGHEAQHRYPHMDLESGSGTGNEVTKRVAVGGREPTVRLLHRLSDGHLVGVLLQRRQVTPPTGAVISTPAGLLASTARKMIHRPFDGVTAKRIGSVVMSTVERC
jgi:hypothetical protein